VEKRVNRKALTGSRIKRRIIQRTQRAIGRNYMKNWLTRFDLGLLAGFLGAAWLLVSQNRIPYWAILLIYFIVILVLRFLSSRIKN
jgi:hypothetical protein